VINEDPVNTARRLSRREYQGRCLLCGRTTKIEQHHVAGRRHDPQFTGPVCLVCHARTTENLRRAGVDMRDAPDTIKRVSTALKATAIFLQMLANALWCWAESLTR